jgi:hypothetical protein
VSLRLRRRILGECLPRSLLLITSCEREVNDYITTNHSHSLNMAFIGIGVSLHHPFLPAYASRHTDTNSSNGRYPLFDIPNKRTFFASCLYPSDNCCSYIMHLVNRTTFAIVPRTLDR